MARSTERPLGRQARLHRSEKRKVLQAERQGRRRSSCARAAGISTEDHVDGRRRSDLGLAVRFRALLLPQRQGAPSAPTAARITTCRKSRAISKRGSGTTSSNTRRSQFRHADRHHQGDGADRNAARRVRDGRNPLRDARSHPRPQCRPLGLHLLVHQAARKEQATS